VPPSDHGSPKDQIARSRPVAPRAETLSHVQVSPPIAALPISRRQAEVSDAQGLHLRQAARFVQEAQRFAAEVRICCNGAEADGKSLLSLLCLAAECGMMLDLEAHGPDAEEAVTALADLISARSHEIQGYQVA
jgi:phosphocarrier protein